VTAPPAADDRGDGTPPSTPGRRKLKRSTRISLIVILILALIAGGGFAASYFLNARHYVSTDNAEIDGQQIMINAPASGTLVDWKITQGTAIQQNELIGRIEIQDGFANPLMSIRAPADGTVAVDNGVPGTYVTAGTELAVAYNLSGIYVTARVNETAVKPVRAGLPVDIYVDAYPHTRFSGRVLDVEGGSANVFSLFPQNNTQGNFQKVTQVIPVKISIGNPQHLDLVPGMSVTVYIHKP
jgi:multidrug resistance efflux pump